MNQAPQLARLAPRSLSVFATLIAGTLAGAGCLNKNCGEFIYKGYEFTEQCGVAYGTKGVWNQSQQTVTLEFGWTTSPARPSMDFRPGATFSATFPDEYLSAGTEVPQEEIVGRCSWSTPQDGQLDLEPYIELSVRGRGFNPDLSPMDRNRYQRFTWLFDCGDGDVLATATDVVELVVRGR